MIIVGAGGLGIEILGILINDDYSGEICFFDENKEHNSLLFNKYRVYSDPIFLKKHLINNDNNFVTGIGNPRIREKVSRKIISLGGKLAHIISKNVSIFSNIKISDGTIIQPGVGMSHGIEMGDSLAIHLNATIGHATKIGKYVNIGPNSSIIGPTEICDYAYIGAQSVVLPGLRIGKQAIIPAGSRVDCDVPDYSTYPI